MVVSVGIIMPYTQSRGTFHDDVIKWKHFPRYRPFVPGIHRSTKASDTELWCFFDLRPNKRLSKQSLRWWFDHQVHYGVIVKTFPSVGIQLMRPRTTDVWDNCPRSTNCHIIANHIRLPLVHVVSVDLNDFGYLWVMIINKGRYFGMYNGIWWE